MKASHIQPLYALEPDQVEPDRATLAALRIAACGCRASARLGVEQACALIDASPEKALHTLLGALPEAFGRPTRFYRPGEAELSFDERWVLAAVDAARRSDDDSLYFLIARRVPACLRRWVAFLVRRVATIVPCNAFATDS
ncbi:hypothetical protein [Pseudosulfitobacter sp. DSM 107133]|uniref:hypothetical protein n=1 Tax=Pseudosulfitobacter sp. DSM 107133 TaxID=2883100 RepID=UPI000DF2EAEA|nr:hypothetical protein [Pseudosulfitobacter sp. DSM 107133]UOA26443.1 hypothetical protein DSM107133_01143 [Pseudosulfitobacter sp. DSM 107133]